VTGQGPDLLACVADFARHHVAPAAANWSLGATPGPALFIDAADLGLTRLQLSRADGGLGASFARKAEVFQILAGAAFGFAMSLVNTHNVAWHLCHTARPDQRDTHLPGLLSGHVSACTALTEPGTGSDVAAITTRATEADDGWVLTGEKTWIVNGRHAGLSIVFAQTGAAGDAAGIGAFLVDLTADGVTRYALDSGFSQASMGTGGFTLHDVTVPKSALLIPPGRAFKSILIEINGARAYVAAMCNGLMRAALDQATAYGHKRQSFGQPLDTYASWRAPLEAAHFALSISQDITAKAVALVDGGQDAQLAAAEAKVAAVDTCQRHLPALLHAMGATGLSPDYCFARHIAAAQIAGFTDGTTSLLKRRIARLKDAPPKDNKD